MFVLQNCIFVLPWRVLLPIGNIQVAGYKKCEKLQMRKLRRARYLHKVRLVTAGARKFDRHTSLRENHSERGRGRTCQTIRHCHRNTSEPKLLLLLLLLCRQGFLQLLLVHTAARLLATTSLSTRARGILCCCFLEGKLPLQFS